MLYMVTFTINIPQMLAYMPYMDPMGYRCQSVLPTEEGNLRVLHLLGIGPLCSFLSAASGIVK